MALPKLPDLLDTLGSRLAGDANQEARLVMLRRLVDDKESELANTIALHSDQQEAVAMGIVKGNWGKQTMDHLRQVITEMISAEQNALELGRARNQQQQARTDFFLALGSIIASALIISLNLAIRADVAQRRDAHRLMTEQASRLASANQELAQAQRSLELALSERESAVLKLATLNQDLDQFAYVAAHDLKAPVRGMANLANWIEEDLGPAVNDAARDHLRLLRNRAGRMEALINGILEYSRAGRGQARTNEVVDVHEVVAEILELLAPSPERITVNIEGRLPVLRAPRVALERVWTNLLSNAIKYSPSQAAQIGISARESVEISGSSCCRTTVEGWPRRTIDVSATCVSASRRTGDGSGRNRHRARCGEEALLEGGGGAYGGRIRAGGRFAVLFHLAGVNPWRRRGVAAMLREA